MFLFTVLGFAGLLWELLRPSRDERFDGDKLSYRS
jgi:hypothetical protein